MCPTEEGGWSYFNNATVGADILSLIFTLKDRTKTLFSPSPPDLGGFDFHGSVKRLHKLGRHVLCFAGVVDVQAEDIDLQLQIIPTTSLCFTRNVPEVYMVSGYWSFSDGSCRRIKDQSMMHSGSVGSVYPSNAEHRGIGSTGHLAPLPTAVGSVYPSNAEHRGIGSTGHLAPLPTAVGSVYPFYAEHRGIAAPAQRCGYALGTFFALGARIGKQIAPLSQAAACRVPSQTGSPARSDSATATRTAIEYVLPSFGYGTTYNHCSLVNVAAPGMHPSMKNSPRLAPSLTRSGTSRPASRHRTTLKTEARVCHQVRW
ncbi:hypothetical protein BD413DRAFT_495227 [Trametes elegans]|nr:hypothetical protein BD413DRAFT_495227 [Trametes elegans]